MDFFNYCVYNSSVLTARVYAGLLVNSKQVALSMPCAFDYLLNGFCILH